MYEKHFAPDFRFLICTMCNDMDSTILFYCPLFVSFDMFIICITDIDMFVLVSINAQFFLPRPDTTTKGCSLTLFLCWLTTVVDIAHNVSLCTLCTGFFKGMVAKR